MALPATGRVDRHLWFPHSGGHERLPHGDSHMPAQLLAVSEGPNILLDKPIMLIGRHQECDIQIPSRKISRRQCCIAQVDDYLVVRDLSSTNGIRINGMRVNEGQLKAGDELTIGNYRYEVQWEVGAAAPIAPAAAGLGVPAQNIAGG